MARRKSKPLKIEDRRKKIAEMLLDGKVYRDIKVELDVSMGTISKDVKAIFDEWKKEYTALNQQRVLVELDRLLFVLDEAQKEWENSKTRKRTKVKKVPAGKRQVKDENGNVIGHEPIYREEVEVIQMYPEPKYLELIRSTSESIRKLFGLDKPAKLDVDHSGSISNPLLDRLSKLSDDELKKIAYKL